MNKIFSIFHVVCIFAYVANASGKDILVSVSEIKSAEQVPSHRVHIFIKVHEPKEVRNTLLHTYTDSTNRADIRKEYLPGSLFRLSVSDELFAKLIYQKSGMDKDELIIDTGIDPRCLSSAHSAPEMEFSLFVQSITKRKPEPNQSR